MYPSQRRIAPGELQQLRDIVARQEPELSPLVDKLQNTLLTADEREALRGATADELLDAGLDSDSEPNKYGFFLESLIERLWFYSVDRDEV
jgi:hypothetical protein